MVNYASLHEGFQTMNSANNIASELIDTADEKEKENEVDSLMDQLTKLPVKSIDTTTGDVIVNFANQLFTLKPNDPKDSWKDGDQKKLRIVKIVDDTDTVPKEVTIDNLPILIIKVAECEGGDITKCGEHKKYKVVIEQDTPDMEEFYNYTEGFTNIDITSTQKAALQAMLDEIDRKEKEEDDEEEEGGEMNLTTSVSEEEEEAEAEAEPEPEPEPEPSITTSSEGFTNYREDFVGNSNVMKSINSRLILKALLFSCLFYLLAHPDTRAFVLNIVKIRKSQYLYLGTLLFLVIYLILNVIV